MKEPPIWDIPENINELLAAENGGIWEDDRWSPILLTLMTGTVYSGRDIPLAWQIEFDPSGPSFETGNRKIETLGLEPDGYGWSSLINTVMKKYHPEIADELQFGDTEEATCVIWVESENCCRQLIHVAWILIHS